MRIKDLFYTGLSDVDLAIGGIGPGEIMVVSAPPAVGKTAFCVSAALFSAVKNKTLYLTSERPEYLARRLTGAETSAPLYIKYVEGVLIEERSEAIPSEMELIFQKYAYEVPDEETAEMDPVEKYTREIPAWLVIIDSLDYAYKYYPKQGDYEALRCELLRKHIKEIKRLAKKYNAAVIITATALETDGEGAELSREVASCAPLVEYLCLLDREGDQDQSPRRVICEIRKNIKSGPGVVTFQDYPCENKK